MADLRVRLFFVSFVINVLSMLAPITGPGQERLNAAGNLKAGPDFRGGFYIFHTYRGTVFA